MSNKPIWKQETSLHYSLQSDETHIDVRYEPAGFQSAWGVYVGSRMIDRCSEFMEARGVAIQAASRAA